MPDFTKMTAQEIDSMIAHGSQPGSPTHTAAVLERERRRDEAVAARAEAQAHRAERQADRAAKQAGRGVAAAWVTAAVATVGAVATVITLVG